MTILINDSKQARNCRELCDIVRPPGYVSLLRLPLPNKRLSDTQNWPKEKRIKKGCDWKRDECVRPASRVAQRKVEERMRTSRHRDETQKESPSLSLYFIFFLSRDKDSRAKRGKENRGSERRVSKMSWQWGVGYIVLRATATDITGTNGGPELPTRDPSDEGELYITQNTIAPLSSRGPASHGPTRKPPPNRLPPNCPYKCRHSGIPPDARCRPVCRSSFRRTRMSSILRPKIRDRGERHAQTRLTLPVCRSVAESMDRIYISVRCYACSRRNYLYLK